MRLFEFHNQEYFSFFFVFLKFNEVIIRTRDFKGLKRPYLPLLPLDTTIITISEPSTLVIL